MKDNVIYMFIFSPEFYILSKNLRMLYSLDLKQQTTGLNCRPWVPYSHMHMCKYSGTCNYILVLLTGWWIYLFGRPKFQLRYKLLSSNSSSGNSSLNVPLHFTDFQQITTSWKQPQTNKTTFRNTSSEEAMHKHS